jgi:hypothetical protein
VQGQWIGAYSGSSEGQIVVNVDEMPSNFRGVAYLFPNEAAGLPLHAGFFETQSKDKDFCFSASVSPLDLSNPNQMFVSWDRIRDRYPGVSTFFQTPRK